MGVMPPPRAPCAVRSSAMATGTDRARLRLVRAFSLTGAWRVLAPTPWLRRHILVRPRPTMNQAALNRGGSIPLPALRERTDEQGRGVTLSLIHISEPTRLG